MEDKREMADENTPLSRESLDELIEKVQKSFENALRTKQFDKCPALHERLDKLKAKRAEMPSIDEMKIALGKAENDLKGALARKDFAQICIQLLQFVGVQTSIDAFRPVTPSPRVVQRDHRPIL